MQQQKNMIAFMIASMLLLGVWMWLQQQIRPPLPNPADNLVDKKNSEKNQAELAKTPAAMWATSFLAGTSFDAALHTAALANVISPPPSPPPAVVVAPPREMVFGEDVALGAQDFFIKAMLTTKGAGVKQLVLNKFKGADRLGEPTGKELELIPEDKYAPSFRLFHYAKTDADHVVGVLGQIAWKLTSETKPDRSQPLKDQVHKVTFTTAIPDPGFEHLQINKTYSLGARDYHVGLELEIKDSRTGKGSPTAFRYQLAGGHGLPIEGWWYTYTYQNSLIGEVDKHGGLWRNFQESRTITQQGIGDRVPTADLGQNYLQYAGVAVQYFASMIVVDDKQTTKNFLEWARPTLQTQETAARIVSIDTDEKTVEAIDKLGDRYTLHLLPRVLNHLKEADLHENEDVVITWYKVEHETMVCTNIERGTIPHHFLNDIVVRVNSKVLELSPGESVTHKYLLYHGPNKVRLLSQMTDSPPSDLMERYAIDLQLATLTDYASPGVVGRISQTIGLTRLLIAITGLMHGLINILHHIVPIYGLTIVLLTIVVRGLMFPISRRQALLSIRMQELGPEMKKLQEKYKNDPQGRSQAQMELYRKHKVNPFGMCLPLLLQMPIFLGLYYALQESVHLRLASFLWIQNLAAPDMTVFWTESIPIISDPDSHGSILYLGPFLNILPIVAVSLMVVHQKLFTPPPTDEQQEATQRMMKYMMIFMGIMFYKVAAGLCIYFIASSLWGLAERQLLPKKKPIASGEIATTLDKNSKSIQSRKPRPGDKSKVKPKENGPLQKMKDWWAEVLEQARKK